MRILTGTIAGGGLYVAALVGFLAANRLSPARTLDAQVSIEPTAVAGEYLARLDLTGIEAMKTVDLAPVRFRRGESAETSWCAPDRSACIRAEFKADAGGDWLSCSWKETLKDGTALGTSMRVRLPVSAASSPQTLPPRS